MESDPIQNNNLLGNPQDDSNFAVTTEEIAAFKIRIRNAFNLFDLSNKNCINKRDVGTIIRYLGYFPTQQDIKKFIMPQINELIQKNRNDILNQQSLNLSNQDENNDEEKQDNDDKNVNNKNNNNNNIPNENEIDYATFETILLEIMKRNLYPCDDEETILNAFKVIQKHFESTEENDGQDQESEADEKKIVYKNDIIAAMKQFGDEFALDSRELDEFLNIAIVTTNKNNKKINQKKSKNNENGDQDDNEVIYYEDYVDELFLQIKNHA